MFNVNEFISKTFELTLFDNEVIHIYAPKVKYRYEISDLISSIDNDASLEKLVNIVLKIINFNSESRKFTKEEIEEMFTEDILIAFINSYSTWLIGEVEEKN